MSSPSPSINQPYSLESILHVLDRAFIEKNKLKIVSLTAFLIINNIYDDCVWNKINNEFILDRSYEPYRFMALILPEMNSEKMLILQNLVSPSKNQKSEHDYKKKRIVGMLNPFAFDFSPYSYDILANEILSHQEKKQLERTTPINPSNHAAPGSSINHNASQIKI